MKNTLTTLAIMILTIAVSTAQDFQEIFLGEDYIQYKGSLFRLKDDASSGFNHTFYADLKYLQKLYDNNVIYPDSEYNFSTIEDSLKNRIFRVEEIVGKDGKPFSETSFLDKPIFVLKDTTSHQIIYYKYDMEYKHSFPFLTSGIKLDIDALCSKIERQVDEFTDEVKINTPFTEGRDISPMIFYKTTNNSKTTYYLSLRSHGLTVNVGESGVIILFDDGTKINKPSEEIDVDVDERGYEYSAFLRLAEAEVKILASKKIKKFRLYIYDKDINTGEAEKFSHYVNCVLAKN